MEGVYVCVCACVCRRSDGRICARTRRGKWFRRQAGAAEQRRVSGLYRKGWWNASWNVVAMEGRRVHSEHHRPTECRSCRNRAT
eukprot:scaffold310_cov335-Pavlova_lutheri.AAC.15